MEAEVRFWTFLFEGACILCGLKGYFVRGRAFVQLDTCNQAFAENSSFKMVVVILYVPKFEVCWHLAFIRYGD